MIEKIATLRDLETWWSLDDILRANALIEFRTDLVIEQRKKAHGNRKRTAN